VIVQQRFRGSGDFVLTQSRAQAHIVEDIPVLSDEMIAALRCPLCHGDFTRLERAVRCENRHNFDLSQYLHLGTGRKLPEGDTLAMVAARSAFLEAGHYAPLVEAIGTHDGLVADLGSGPGHYLAAALSPTAQGLALDVSKPALRRAAKLPRVGAVLTDTWRDLPLRSGGVDVLLNVFAPRNGAEMHRVLRPGGLLIVVTPQPDHLRELRDAYGLLDVDPSKEDRLAQALQDFAPVDETLLRWEMDLSTVDAQRLVDMGPNAFHHTVVARAMRVTASVRLSRWTGRPLPSPPAAHGSGR
jgi:23S rRNA (guanine745-N1)-methyltransferase